MAEILKPCPFCGGKAEYNSVAVKFDSCSRGFDFDVRCSKCGATAGRRIYSVTVRLASDGEIENAKDERPEAADVWNRRAENG